MPALHLPDDHSTTYLENTKSLEYNDLTMTGMGLNNPSWAALDLDPHFPPFDTDFAFDPIGFGLQNGQSPHSSSALTENGFDLNFGTFDSPDFSFGTPSTFGFEQFSHPSSNLTDFTSIVSNNNPSFSVPSVVAPALVNASQPGQISNASSFMQFQPTTADALPPAIASAPVTTSSSNESSYVVHGNAPQHFPASSNASPHPSPSNASSPTVVPDAQHIPPPSNASPWTPVSPATASSDASPPPAENVESPQPLPGQSDHTSAKSGITPPSPFFNSDSLALNSDALNSDSLPSQVAGNADTSAVSSDSDTSSSVPLNQADGRRSGRHPVPSKRHEQMNEIDGKTKNKTVTLASDHLEKENIPTTTPEWAVASHEHLLKSDLGKDWTACVQAWFDLERELGYGSQPGAKVCLILFSFFEHQI